MKTHRIIVAVALMAVILPAANAQKRDWGCEPDKQEEMMAQVSLYQQDVKSYKSSKDARYLIEAYDKWKLIVATCPKQSKNLYLNGVNILKAKINASQSREERNGYIDELMAMYDTRIANYGEAAEVTAKKAMDLELLRGDSAIAQVYEIYSEAVKIGGNELDAAYVVKYMEATIKYVRAGLAEPTLVVDNYDIASELLDKELEANASDTVKYRRIEGYIAGVENAFSPYAGCNELVNIYTKKFEADRENVELLKKITNILMKKGCSKEQLFFDATEQLYALEPSPSTALRMGQMSFSKEQYDKAVQYLSDAVKGLTEKKDLYKAYILLGHAQTEMNSYSAARTSFNKAAEVEPTKGEPFLLIANLYAQSARMVNDNLNGRSVYWAAVDKARKALNTDPSEEVREQAQKMISQFSSYFPKKTDAFMLNLLDGQGYTVGSWIGEGTVVRTRP